MITEIAFLYIRPGQTKEFEASFEKAGPVIAAQEGFIDLALQHCIEQDHKYCLVVRWQNLEDHTIGFRLSEGYQEWKKLLHHFYDPFPVVEHYKKVTV